MTSQKRKPTRSDRRHMLRLERLLQAIEAEIARREKDRGLGLATQDHFILWRRSCFFAPWSPELQYRPAPPLCAPL
ncbi:hypothetical protein [Microvirga arsenatis]|uniref:Uncharacterized protein n=1 Tax=Microvirga arsenatis TaxID=2692265 RepID=A0ABW9Z2Y9_9HYPH|nr:hypothetical protein [Microvirga arsenatis]NBJ13584.1 hypothetical protein [Microvirga arsenatis]NBJ27057.1 hypothetical protein [Microvirga arsenatis]